MQTSDSNVINDKKNIVNNSIEDKSKPREVLYKSQYTKSTMLNIMGLIQYSHVTYMK